MNTAKLLRLPDVLALTASTRSTHYLRIQQRLMTPPVKLGERCAAWPVSEVEAINAARIAGKTTDEIRELVARLVEARTAEA